MATKAAKSITINATKYELANTLDYQNGKVQLKAKDVVLDEVEVGDSDFVITLDSSNELYMTGTKTCTSFSVAELKAAVDAGKTVRIVGSNLLNEDDNHSDTIDLVCSCNDSFQGAQIWMSTMCNMKALIFIVGLTSPDTKTSINLVHISDLSSI